MSEYKRIHHVSREEWLALEHKRQEWLKTNYPDSAHTTGALESHERRMREREDIIARFPHTVILTGAYPEHDFVSRWCWRNIGPHDCKKCYDYQSEYPGCPLVLATEYIQTGWYNTNDGKRVDWQEKAYKEVEEHSHEGKWTAFWLGKTGYDYGSSEYCFANESDRDRFLAAVPIFNLGEKYEKDGAE